MASDLRKKYHAHCQSWIRVGLLLLCCCTHPKVSEKREQLVRVNCIRKRSITCKIETLGVNSKFGIFLTWSFRIQIGLSAHNINPIHLSSLLTQMSHYLACDWWFWFLILYWIFSNKHIGMIRKKIETDFNFHSNLIESIFNQKRKNVGH